MCNINALKIAERVDGVLSRISKAAMDSGRRACDVQLIAVTKFQTAESVRFAYDAGCRHFGENYAQEAAGKRTELGVLGQDVWHMIGGLQTNKSMQAVQTFDCIHTIDRSKLALAVGSTARSVERFVDVLIQVDLADTMGRSGCSPANIGFLVDDILAQSHLRLKGLMAMAPAGLGDTATRAAFAGVRRLYEALPTTCQCILSMGMSGDYPLAIAEGATVVRVGTAIFGDRPKVG